MVCLGEYKKSYYKNRMIRLPERWVKCKTHQLYCGMCQDEELDVYFLRFFYDKNDLKEWIKEVKHEKNCKIHRCSRHRIVPLFRAIQLPKEFCSKWTDSQVRDVICVGIKYGFEIWNETDYRKMCAEFTSITDITDYLDLATMEPEITI